MLLCLCSLKLHLDHTYLPSYHPVVSSGDPDKMRVNRTGDSELTAMCTMRSVGEGGIRAVAELHFESIRNGQFCAAGRHCVALASDSIRRFDLTCSVSFQGCFRNVQYLCCCKIPPGVPISYSVGKPHRVPASPPKQDIYDLQKGYYV